MQLENKIGLSYNATTQELHIIFENPHGNSDFDICEENGILIKTGSLSDQTTLIKLNDAQKDCYIVLVQNGGKVYTNRFFTNKS